MLDDRHHCRPDHLSELPSQLATVDARDCKSYTNTSRIRHNLQNECDHGTGCIHLLHLFSPCYSHIQLSKTHSMVVLKSKQWLTSAARVQPMTPFLPQSVEGGKEYLKGRLESAEWLNAAVQLMWRRYPTLVGEWLRKDIVDEILEVRFPVVFR